MSAVAIFIITAMDSYWLGICMWWQGGGPEVLSEEVPPVPHLVHVDRTLIRNNDINVHVHSTIITSTACTDLD